MKTIYGLMLAAALGAAGCTSANKSLTGDPYAADEPLAERRTEKVDKVDKATGEPTAFGPAVSRVNPADIDDENVHDYTRRLQSDIKTDRSALTKGGGK